MPKDEKTPVRRIGCPYHVSEELDKTFKLDKSGHIELATPPDSSDATGAPHLPGQPTLMLCDVQQLTQYLQGDLLTPDLNTMAPHLWLVSTQSSAHISALHAQIVRGRRIVVSENPELHLLWIDDRIFVKPIPAYLLSHAFWTIYLDPAVSPIGDAEVVEGLLRATLGYLRTWTYLVRHECDFRLARENYLVPREISYAQFRGLIDRFGSDGVSDGDVSPRYLFGEIRLSRLNFWAKFFLRRWMFHKVKWQYWQYFAAFYAPLLFVFGVLSVTLSAMQVALSTNAIWKRFNDTSKWFSVLTLLVIVLIAASMLSLFLLMFLRELVFATRARLKKRKTRTD